MPGQGNRWAPLTGVLFTVLVIVGGPVLASVAPDSSASGETVITVYTVHQTQLRVAAVVLTLSFISLVFFTGTLREHLKADPSVEGISSVMLGGAVLLAVGQTVGAGASFALSDAPQHLESASAQTLNLVANDVVMTSAAGFFILGLASAIAILRSHILPNWLGWVALVFGVLAITPAEAITFFVIIVWVPVVAILLIRRNALHDQGAVSAATSASASASASN